MSGILMSLVSGASQVFSLFLGGTVALNGGGSNNKATLNFISNGTFGYNGTPTPSPQAWYTPTTTSIGNSYWVRATLVSGSAPNEFSEPLNTWLQITADRRWELLRLSSGTGTSTLDISLSRDSAGTAILATRRYVLSITMP